MNLLAFASFVSMRHVPAEMQQRQQQQQENCETFQDIHLVSGPYWKLFDLCESFVCTYHSVSSRLWLNSYDSCTHRSN